MIDDNPGLIDYNSTIIARKVEVLRWVDQNIVVSFSEIFGYLRKFSQSSKIFENVRNVCLTSDKSFVEGNRRKRIARRSGVNKLLCKPAVYRRKKNLGLENAGTTKYYLYGSVPPNNVVLRNSWSITKISELETISTMGCKATNAQTLQTISCDFELFMHRDFRLIR